MAALDIESSVSPAESETRVLPRMWERVAARLVPVSPSGTGKTLMRFKASWLSITSRAPDENASKNERPSRCCMMPPVRGR